MLSFLTGCLQRHFGDDDQVDNAPPYNPPSQGQGSYPPIFLYPYSLCKGDELHWQNMVTGSAPLYLSDVVQLLFMECHGCDLVCSISAIEAVSSDGIN